MDRVLVRPHQVLGHRGLFLLTLGIVCLGVAMRTLTNPPPHAGDLFSSLPVLAHIGLWLSTGTITTVSAFLRAPGVDTPAFVILAGVTLARGLSFLWLWITSLTDALGGRGDQNAWFGALCWICAGILTMSAANWDEPRTSYQIDRS